MSTLGVLTLSNAEKPHQHLAFNIESPYGSYLLDRFEMTSRWPMTKNRRPWICTERILWGLTSFLIYKLTFVSTNLHSLLATWVKSLYQIVSHDFSSAIFVYKKMKTGLEAKYALTKYCLIYEQECSIRFKTQGLGLIKRELVVNQMA